LLTLPEYLTDLEAQILSVIIVGFSTYTEPLAIQLASSRLESRELNGYGFFTNFLVDENAPSCDLVDGRLHASARIGTELCGFMIWVKNGKISFLEGYPLGGDALPLNGVVTELKLGGLD
jgi:hypothetical protein